MKIYSIPLTARSVKNDYACADGEIAGGINLKFDNGTLSGISSDVTTVDGAIQTAPFPAVEFALRQEVVPGWHIHTDMLPSKVVDAPSVAKDAVPTESDWGERALQTIVAFEDDATRYNLFTQLFFVVAAWKLNDGSHICPTTPVLMIPNSGAPVATGSSDFSVETMKISVVEAGCRLQWKTAITEISDYWKERIVGLDVFVSDPVSMYDVAEGANGYHRFECTNFTRSIGADGTSGDRQIYTETITQGWKASPVHPAVISQRLRNIKSFRLVAGISLASLVDTSDFEDVPMSDGCLKVLWDMESYIPDSTSNTEDDELSNVTDSSWKEFIPSEWDIDVSDSSSADEWGVFVTRPIKLSGAEDRKQLLSVDLRGVYDRQNISLAIYSSEDLCEWHRIALVDKGTVSGLWATKSRFFRIAVKGSITSAQALAIISNE